MYVGYIYVEKLDRGDLSYAIEVKRVFGVFYANWNSSIR